MDQKSNFPGVASQLHNKKKIDFSSLFEKISFFPSLEKNTLFSKNKKTNFQKNMTSKFHKRIQNIQFEKTQKLFCKKFYESENFSKDVSIVSKYSKNPSFFGKKLKTQCFTCFPFKQNVKNESFIVTPHAVPTLRLAEVELFKKEQHSKISFKNNKLHLKVEQGWLVFPFPGWFWTARRTGQQSWCPTGPPCQWSPNCPGTAARYTAV